MYAALDPRSASRDRVAESAAHASAAHAWTGWHWHNTEPIYADRDAGVPVASAFWIMASCGSLALTLRACPDDAAWGVVAGPAAYLGLMHLPFLVIFHPIVTFAQYHALYAMWALRVVCAWPLMRRLGAPRPEKALLVQMLAFVGGICALALCDPTSETRTSYGQPCVKAGGACVVKESCFWGAFSRKKFVCTGKPEPHDLFRVCDPACGKAAATDELSWYTSCGVAAEEGWHLAVFGHALVVVALSLVPLRRPPSSSSETGGAASLKRE